MVRTHKKETVSTSIQLNFSTSWTAVVVKCYLYSRVSRKSDDSFFKELKANQLFKQAKILLW